MSLSIYNARLLDPATGLDTVGAIFVDRGRIKDIAEGRPARTRMQRPPSTRMAFASRPVWWTSG